MSEFSNSTNDTNIFNNRTDNETSLIINNYMKKGKPFFTFRGFVIFIIDVSIVIGPSLGYLMQLLKFNKTKSSKGFSKSICLIIYFSQILRVFFWIGKPFKITLLYQSILIICFQVFLIYLWIKYHDTESDKNKKQANDIKYNETKDIIEYIIDWSDTISPNKIWNWTNIIEYYKFMFLIILFLLLICGVIGIHNAILVNVIGTISVISEASTLIPQIIVSCRKKQAGNLSMSMVALWFIGDSCKFIYNIIYKTPIQMIASGGLQIFLDFFSLMQIICYRDNNPHYKSTDETNITIPNFTNTKSKKVQQINQFMNKLEERFSEEVESNKNSNRDENEKHLDKNDSKKVFNTIIVPEKIENSDKIEVLDKSQHDKIENHSDDEEEKNENNLKPETEQNLNDEKNENENQDENKEDINQ
jgi:uncharacterized protein with PQ loop repeat